MPGVDLIVSSLRMYLTSCGCLLCQDCGPKSLKNGQCLICNAKKVSAKPIGQALPTQQVIFVLRFKVDYDSSQEEIVI